MNKSVAVDACCRLCTTNSIRTKSVDLSTALRSYDNNNNSNPKTTITAKNYSTFKYIQIFNPPNYIWLFFFGLRELFAKTSAIYNFVGIIYFCRIYPFFFSYITHMITENKYNE